MKSFRRILLIFVIVLVALVTVLFSLQNTTSVSVNFLIGKYQASIAVWLIGSFVGGGLVGILASSGLLLRLKHSQIKQGRQARAFEKEISRLNANVTAGVGRSGFANANLAKSDVAVHLQATPKN